MHLFRILSPLGKEIQTREHHSCASLTSYVTLLVVLHPSSLSLSDNDATVQQALDALNRHQWVHLACHGMPNRQKPFESSFAMCDGPLTITDIIRSRLRQPEFAFLSACRAIWLGYIPSHQVATLASLISNKKTLFYMVYTLCLKLFRV